MLEAGVAKRGKLLLKGIGRNLLKVECLGKGESSEPQCVQPCGSAGEFSTGHPQTRFELRQIRLRYAPA